MIVKTDGFYKNEMGRGLLGQLPAWRPDGREVRDLLIALLFGLAAAWLLMTVLTPSVAQAGPGRAGQHLTVFSGEAPDAPRVALLTIRAGARPSPAPETPREENGHRLD